MPNTIYLIHSHNFMLLVGLYLPATILHSNGTCGKLWSPHARVSVGAQWGSQLSKACRCGVCSALQHVLGRPGLVICKSSYRCSGFVNMTIVYIVTGSLRGHSISQVSQLNKSVNYFDHGLLYIEKMHRDNFSIYIQKSVFRWISLYSKLRVAENRNYEVLSYDGYLTTKFIITTLVDFTHV